jgi:hypothetical protein
LKPTLIVYAHPATLRILADEMVRFSGRRTSVRDRLYAAWKVFSGKADALSWEYWGEKEAAEYRARGRTR